MQHHFGDVKSAPIVKELDVNKAVTVTVIGSEDNHISYLYKNQTMTT